MLLVNDEIDAQKNKDSLVATFCWEFWETEARIDVGKVVLMVQYTRGYPIGRLHDP